MNKTYTNTLHILSKVLNMGSTSYLATQLDKHTPLSFSEEDWNLVYQECRQHGILLLTYEYVEANCNVESIVEHWQKDAMRQVAWGMLLLEEQKNVLSLLSSVRPVIIKGAATAYCYPKPEYRQMGDIDLVVLDADMEACKKLLCKIGYLPGEENRRHISFYKNGITLELHRRNTDTVGKTAWYDRMDYVVTRAEQTQEISLSGYIIPIFEDTYNGLIILTHLLHHMAGGIGLRQLIDWRMYCERYLSDDAWNISFQPLVKEMGIDVYTKIVTRTCQLYLGLRDDITWCRNVDERICDSFICYVMEQGNFGSKLEYNSQSMDVLVRSTGVKNMFINLQRQGTYNWKALEKYEWLTPFAWLYQGFRYIKRGCEQEISWKDLKDEKTHKRELDVLFKKMDLE